MQARREPANAPFPDPDPVRREGVRSTIDTVVEAVTDAIRDGHVVPGQRLVEQEFARRIGVSRSSVREAFQRLAADGLLVAVPNRGVTVRQLSRQEVDHLFDIRAALETLSVRRAVPVLGANPTPLRELLHCMDAAVDAGLTRRYSDLNRAFHGLFAQAAGNPQLSALLERMGHTIYALQFRLMIEPREVLDTHEQHRRLVAAVLDGDADAAEATIRAHLESTRRLIQALPDHHFAGPATPP